MRELRPGLWHWEAPHPDWNPDEPWGQMVSSYAIDDGKRLLLFDPLAVPSELEERATDRDPVVVLTAPWHERDAQSLVERLDAPVYAPPPDTQEDLMEITVSLPSRPPVVVLTWPGCSAATHSRSTCSGPATGCRSGPRCIPEGNTTTSCSGSRTSMR